MFEALKNFGLPAGAILFVITLFWLLEHPDIYDRIKALIIRPIKDFSIFLQKQYLASDIQSKLGAFSRQIIEEIGERDSAKAKIKWVKTTSPESFIDDGKVIIRMDCQEHRYKNLSLATLLYVSQTVAKEGKRYADSTLREGIDLTAAKKIFDKRAEKDEKDYFTDAFYIPMVESDEKLKEDCGHLTKLEEKGFFTRLYLRELRFVGERLAGAYATEGIQQELRDFLRYLFRISGAPTLQAGGDFLNPEDWYFRGNHIKVQLVLFARYGNVELENIRPYIKRVKSGLQSGIDVFYLISTEPSMDFLDRVLLDLDHRLVRQGILKRTSDRKYKLKRSKRGEHESIRCLIYRTTKTLSENEIDCIFEDMVDELDEN